MYKKSTVESLCVILATMNEEEQILTLLSSSNFYNDEADKLLAEFRACKTEFARAKLIPKLEAIRGKLTFQLKETEKHLPPNEA